MRFRGFSGDYMGIRVCIYIHIDRVLEQIMETTTLFMV